MKTLRHRSRLIVAAAVLSLGAGLALATPASAADDNLITVDYDASGSSHIQRLNTDLPISKSTLTATLDLGNDAHPNYFNVTTGKLPLKDQTVQFNALGFLPVRATVSLIETSPITGKINVNESSGDLTLAVNVKYTLKLSNVYAKIFGIWTPLFVGNSCQTIKPLDINLASPAGQTFDVFSGGKVAGKYTIGLLAGCKAFFIPGIGTLAIDALVPGANNTINIDIANGRAST